MTVLPLLDNQLNNKKQSQLKYVLSGGEINYDNTGSGHTMAWNKQLFLQSEITTENQGRLCKSKWASLKVGRAVRL